MIFIFEIPSNKFFRPESEIEKGEAKLCTPLNEGVVDVHDIIPWRGSPDRAVLNIKD